MAAILLCGASISAAAAAPEPLTVKQAHAAIDEIARLVTKDYVFPEMRAGIVAELRKREAAGRYDITNPALFAQTVSEDMTAISHDRHMWFNYDPGGYKAAKRPQNDPHTDAYYAEASKRENYGYDSLRILPGDIRYVDLSGFDGGDAAIARVVADVARFLSGGDAIIFDISGNGGGSAEAVQAIISYFLPPDGRVLMTFHDGLTGKSNSTHAIKKLAGPRLTGIPLYVLISGSTGSAAEEFSYHIRNFKLGTLIGTTTAGAANNDTAFPVAPYFLQSISTGRPVHPVTGTNWEHVGVAPDITVPRDKALATAQVTALKALIAKGSASHRADYEWALVAAKAALNPAHVEAAALSAYAGQYGTRKVWVADGKLMYQREGRDPTTLNLLSGDLFALGNRDSVRIRFKREGGKVTGFETITADGQAIPVKRAS